jgi:cysteine synthase
MPQYRGIPGPEMCVGGLGTRGRGEGIGDFLSERKPEKGITFEM